MKGFNEFRQALKKRENEKEELKIKTMANVVRMTIEGMQTRGEAQTTMTQITKTKQPPIWSGQLFEKWKIEVERWSENNRSSEEDKYVDLMESLKKNDNVKEFVTTTMMEKLGGTRTIVKILEILAERYDRNTSEKTLEIMKKISGDGFRTEECRQDD